MRIYIIMVIENLPAIIAITIVFFAFVINGGEFDFVYVEHTFVFKKEENN